MTVTLKVLHTITHVAFQEIAPRFEVPRELCLPRRKATDFNALKCPFGCEPYFVSKAALQRHRVRLHKGRRTPKDLPTEQFEYVPLFDDIEKIIRRADNDSKEFIVQTTSNTFEWRSLPLEHELVKKNLQANRDADPLPLDRLPLVNLQQWVAGGVLLEDSEDSENEDEEMEIVAN